MHDTPRLGPRERLQPGDLRLPHLALLALAPVGTNLLIIGVLFVLFLGIETTFFVRSEQNR